MERKTVIAVVFSIVCVVLLVSGGAGANDNPVSLSRELYRRAMEFYNEKDYDGYLDTMLEINRVRHNHPAVLYNLAGAYALTGDREGALRWLGKLAGMGLIAGPEQDADFRGIAASDGFAEVVARFARNAEPVGRGDTAFALTQTRFIPEGIAHDPLTGNFYVGSVYKRSVVEVVPGESHINGRTHAAESRTFATWERGDGLWSVFGLAVDANRRVLWVCSSAIEQTPGTDGDDVGWAGVFEYDLTTRLPIERYVLSNRHGAHLFGDLAVGRGGTVYVTDSLERSIYRLDGAAGTFERWLAPAGGTRFASPQGIVFSRDERYLFVADYSYGILRIGVADRDVRLLPYPEDMAVVGIDGLARHGRDLIAVQNGVKPHRVIRMVLNDGRDRIVKWETLQANLPGFDEPTLGVVVGDRGGRGAAFYYVANSHWGAFDREWRLREDARLTPPLIFRLRLD